MSWIGKVGGGLLGFAAGGPLGAVIGALLGHEYDRGALGVVTRQRRRRSGPGGSRQYLFFETTFLVMGHLAKVDGVVSEAEIQAARAVMRRMRLSSGDVRRAIDLFTRGKQADFPVEVQVERLRHACADQPELLRAFLELQLDLALAKESISTPERALLTRIAERLGVGHVELAHMEALLRARRNFFGQERTGSSDSLAQAYESLGIRSSATDQEVKTAYRRLMNQHHPDKQAARGLPESMMEIAKERTAAIRAAYDLIRERRGMK
jgi:DnaJ like chaperone protein